MRKTLTGMMAAMMLMACGCDDEWCGGGPGGQSEASLYVSDAKTGAPIATPKFYLGTSLVVTTCGDHDVNNVCTMEILQLASGKQSVVVTADGYQQQVVDIDTTSSDSVHLAVELQPAQ